MMSSDITSLSSEAIVVAEFKQQQKVAAGNKAQVDEAIEAPPTGEATKKKVSRKM